MAHDPPAKKPEDEDQPGKLVEGKAKVETWAPPVRRYNTDQKELRHEQAEEVRALREGKKAETSLRAETGPLWRLPEEEDAFRSNKENPDDETHSSFLRYKAKAEFGKAGYDLKERKAEVVAADAHFDGSVGHTQANFIKSGMALLGVKDPRPPSGTVFAPMAARVGDPTAHGTPLLPGSGSPDVVIEGLPAWRTVSDVHLCPISHPHHKGGTVLTGASTVFINFQQAVRAGDYVVEKGGGRNHIVGGAAEVFIGEAAQPVAGQRKEFQYLELGGQADFLKGDADLQLKGELDLKKMNAQVVAKAGAKASVVSGSVDGKTHIPIPFTGYNLALGGSAEGAALTLGADGELSGMINRLDPKTRKKTLVQLKAKAFLGLAVLGGGLGITLGIEED